MAAPRFAALKLNLPLASTAAPLLVLMVLGMMLLPLPALALDGLFTFNIGVSMLVLLAAMNMRSFKDFVAFPSILLLTTLLRLSLNVASTRVVLLNGHTGTAAAGNVIEAFAEFLIGGSYAVGVVVFLILTIINFVVITKGAGRVAEVAARFALDAMPGKQMAIDADLNTGAIREEEARRRRAEVGQEADFYGSMDGASKFVRGDAMVGILILIINLVGGVAVGTMQHGLDFGSAMQIYATLAVGDGLVAQVPALIISTAAGIVVTRVSTEQDFSAQLGAQLVAGGQSFYVVAGILTLLGLIPGMPHLAFLTFAGLFGGLGWLIMKRQAAATLAKAAAQLKPASTGEVDWNDVPVIEPLCLELPYRLISLVDAGDNSDLIKRIRAIRKKFVGEVGFLIPSVHIRDNLQLPAEVYRFLLYGAEVARGQVLPDRLLAIDPPGAHQPIEGIAVRDPTYGMPATWITRDRRSAAMAAGYTVVEPAVAITTHLDQLISQHAHELLGRQETHELIEHFKSRFPKLVEETIPKLVQPAQLQRVMQLLLEEGVTVRDLRTILEVSAEHFAKNAHPNDIVAPLRQALRRQIVQDVFGDATEYRVAGVHPDFERLIDQAVGTESVAPDGAIEPNLARRFLEESAAAIDELETLGQAPVLLCGQRARLTLSRLARRVRPQAVVLAMSELPTTAKVEFQRIVCQRQ
ncbi:MAG: flagellar biosynthesis protein FlhA [Betaproteobacteria bacterium]|nr:flagellar biosynthesis protein FlhA [Betaproteobacteria bacterium]